MSSKAIKPYTPGIRVAVDAKKALHINQLDKLVKLVQYVELDSPLRRRYC